MEKPSRKFKVVDILLLVLTVLPLLFGMLLKILFTPASEGISITGALIYFDIPFPIQNLVITESQINTWLVMIALFFFISYLTHGMRKEVDTKRSLLAEWIVEKTDGLVKQNMGEHMMGFSPFIAAIMGLSAFSSLLSLIGLYAPTSDINIVGGWAIIVFILITFYKMQLGPIHYIKSFGDPVPFLAPLNIISEFATPVSMAFRHYGNILSGAVISTLIATALGGLSHMVLGWIPGFFGQFPIFRIGLPAVLSIYFDVFSGLLQAFIFAMLTMLYVGGAFTFDDYQTKKLKRQKKLNKN